MIFVYACVCVCMRVYIYTIIYTMRGSNTVCLCVACVLE